jgi:hypothetical protein
VETHANAGVDYFDGRVPVRPDYADDLRVLVLVTTGLISVFCPFPAVNKGGDFQCGGGLV